MQKKTKATDKDQNTSKKEDLAYNRKHREEEQKHGKNTQIDRKRKK